MSVEEMKEKVISEGWTWLARYSQPVEGKPDRYLVNLYREESWLYFKFWAPTEIEAWEGAFIRWSARDD